MKALRPSGYERVYLPLHHVTDTPFHVQGGGGAIMLDNKQETISSTLQILMVLENIIFCIKILGHT